MSEHLRSQKKLETTGCIDVLLKLMIIPWIVLGPAVGFSSSGYGTLIFGITVTVGDGALILFLAFQAKQKTMWYRKQA